MSPAERVLRSLGVTEPEEIDLDAIAWSLGVVAVKRRTLDGCEARIVGYGGRAVITVDDRRHPQRQRFSIGHEIGHWCHHRGRTLICRPEEIGSASSAPSAKVAGTERAADAFAAELLLPRYLLEPIARPYPKLTLKVLRAVAGRFDTSLSATAIRLAELGHSPFVLVCHGQGGRRWFRRSRDVPERWYPRGDLDRDSFAFDLVYGTGTEQPFPRKVGAEAWFDRREAEEYELEEQSFRVSDDEVLTILHITDDCMLEDRPRFRP